MATCMQTGRLCELWTAFFRKPAWRPRVFRFVVTLRWRPSCAPGDCSTEDCTAAYPYPLSTILMQKKKNCLLLVWIMENVYKSWRIILVKSEVSEYIELVKKLLPLITKKCFYQGWASVNQTFKSWFFSTF